MGIEYLLDADVFIKAKNLHYGFDSCPAFWEWIAKKHFENKVFSVEKIGDELSAGNDRLSEWAKKMGDDFFIKPSGKLFSALQDISKWVDSQQYTLSAINTFKQVADYYLIGHAYANSSIVVTHETPGTKRKVKIPDVCNGMRIKCMTPFQMLRKEKAYFVLGTREGN